MWEIGSRCRKYVLSVCQRKGGVGVILFTMCAKSGLAWAIGYACVTEFDCMIKLIHSRPHMSRPVLSELEHKAMGLKGFCIALAI